MCGRFAFDADLGQLEDRFAAGAAFSRLTPHYNVAPGMFMPVITRNSPNTAVMARWGLVPHWAKDPAIGYKLINARAESVADKPAFRSSFRNKRCLVPTSGFFEWKHIDKEKVPYFIRLKGADMFAFAGLYDEWKDAEGYPVLTFTIITTAPNDLMEPIHSRMPVIFSREDEDVWLDPDEHDEEKLKKLLDPYPSGGMEAYPVSKLVNSPANDTPDVLKPQGEQASLL